jgi:hypothetical protein
VKLLNEDAKLICKHRGTVQIVVSQHLVTISGRPVLVENDPEGRSISRCPNVGPSVNPCRTTYFVRQGYSELLRVQGHRVCLDPVYGFTDGMPAGFVKYVVSDPGQEFVSQRP